MQHILEIEDVVFRWPGRGAFGIAVDRFAVAPGERVMLLGPSGSGKSTLLSLVAGIVAPQRGRVEIRGENFGTMGAAVRDTFRAEHIGVIFQMFNLLPYGSVIDNVLLPLSFAPGRRARCEARGGVRAEAVRLLEQLGLSGAVIEERAASMLSVGQQQRVAAARALIGRPDLVIADEPTSALDRNRQTQFIDLIFAELEAVGAAMIMVSHDETLVSRFDRVVQLEDIARRLEEAAA